MDKGAGRREAGAAVRADGQRLRDYPGWSRMARLAGKGIGQGVTRLCTMHGHPERVMAFQDAAAAVDSAGVCVFTTVAWGLADLQPQVAAACGEGVTLENLALIGERLVGVLTAEALQTTCPASGWRATAPRPWTSSAATGWWLQRHGLHRARGTRGQARSCWRSITRDTMP